MPLMKYLQFLNNQAETLAILPIHEIVIFTKFQINWTKIVDFSLVAYSCVSAIFHYLVSSWFKKEKKKKKLKCAFSPILRCKSSYFLAN